VAIAACCALRIFDAATICIALVICEVPRIDLMRRRRSRGLFIISYQLPAASFQLCTCALAHLRTYHLRTCALDHFHVNLN
jgi:hypothetical protein